MLTDIQKDKLNAAMDLIIDVIRELENTNKDTHLINSLDDITGNIYNVIWSK